jgi:hypothetical protein
MVNGDHGNVEATTTVDSSNAEQRETAPTQNDGRRNDDEGDDIYCTQVVPPREPQAFLRFKEELEPAQRNLKLQLPTEPNSEVLINLGRLKPTESNSARYQQLVRLIDSNRPLDKQIISREHSQILIRKSGSGDFTVSIKDTKNHDRRRTVIFNPNGESRVVNHEDFQPLLHGDLIHLTPRAPPIHGDPAVLHDYQYFRFELDFPEIITRGSGASSDKDEESPDISLKFLLHSPLVGKLMGTGGSTIRQIRDANNCDLVVSPWGSFHPASVASQGRTVQCIAKTPGSLSNSLADVLDTIFAENRHSAHLQFVLPKEVITTALGPSRLLEIQQSSGVTLYIRPPTPTFTEEQILEGRGSLEAFDKLLPLLCASLCFPLRYRYGTEYESLRTAHRDPAAASRLKRKRYVERANLQAEKRSKHHTWGPNRGPGHRGAGLGAGARGAARH